jgi:hypothetical protein
MSGMDLTWTEPGPVSRAFLDDESSVSVIMGPIGAGKTTTNLFKHFLLSTIANVSPIDGKRRYRVGVVRDTYRELWSTTIPSWWKRVPPDVGEWTGGRDQPAVHKVTINLGDRTTAELEVWFRAIGEQAVEAALRGIEPTSWYLNEIDLLAPEVLIYAKSRVGRYPDMAHGGPGWYGVTGDLNAPDTENYIYKLFVEKPQPGHKLFIQPSGFDPAAENLDNLPADYYQRASEGQPEWWIRRFIRNQWGYSRFGTPVYPEYNDQLHVAADDLKPVEGIPMLIGLDAGKHPAAVFEQHMPDGQWRWELELYGPGMGPTRFSELLNQAIKDFCPWHAKRAADGAIIGYADPSAAFGGDGEDHSWLQVVRAKTHLTIRPAPTNKFAPRRDVLFKPLTTLIDGNRPGFLISPRACPLIRAGFNALYRYRDRKVMGQAVSQMADEIEKNDNSHPMEAGQYAMLGGGEYYELQGRKGAQLSAALGQAHALTDDDAGAHAPSRFSFSKRGNAQSFAIDE